MSGVFFFQAEDGIRDVAVTGVQTCALPIYVPTRPATSRLRPGRAHRATASVTAPPTTSPPTRSEERRVGKSVDLGGRRIIKKKKTKNRERISLNKTPNN